MSWVWGFIGAILALGMSEADSGTRTFLLGVLGFVAAWLLSATRRQRRELESLRERVERLDSDVRRDAVPGGETAPRPLAVAPAEQPPRPQVPVQAPVRPVATTTPPVMAPQPVRPPYTPPPTPEWELRLRAAFVRWFTVENLPVLLGVPVLLFGVAAFLKYAADAGFLRVPIELRLAGIALAAMGALAFGWRERERRRAFSLGVQGGALAALLLTIFAAFRLYALLPAGMAFALMLVVVAGTACLAVLQDALALAVLSIAGGFMAPVLISTGGGSHVALFSYYALLNAGVVAMVWFRGWRALSLVGFAFTFVIGTAWGARYYRPEFLATTEPFLVLFFLCYVGLAVLDAVRRQAAAKRDAIDVALVFGVPLAAFPLQTALLRDHTLALAFSALAIAALYAALAYWALRARMLVTLGYSVAALAIGFAALAVPLALSARWTACAWAVQGAALIWIGLRGQRALSCYFGALVQLLAICAYFTALVDAPDAAAILNGEFLAGVLVSAAVLFAAQRFEQSPGWLAFEWVAFCAGGLVWTVTIVHESSRFPYDVQSAAWAGLLALTLALGGALRQRVPWERFGWPIAVALGVTFLSALALWNEGPLHGWGWLTWPLALGTGVYALRTLERPRATPIAAAHSAWLAALATLLGSELHVRSSSGLSGGWVAAAAVLPLALLLAATWLRERIAAFPLAAVFASYRLYWFGLATLGLAGWWAWSLGQEGLAEPLPFVPLLNPLELLQVATLLLVYGIWREHARPSQRTEIAFLTLGAGFLTLTMMTLRAVHHFGAQPWSPTLLELNVSQTSLSIVWSVLGVSAWIVGSRSGSRPIWLAGALLMGVVLAKLFFVDRRFMGDLPGIVSFLVVGGLMVVVGYVAPSPPRAATLERSG